MYKRDCPGTSVQINCPGLVNCSPAVMVWLLMWLSFCVLLMHSVGVQPPSDQPATCFRQQHQPYRPQPHLNLAFFRSHPHRHHHHNNTIHCKSALFFCLRVLLKAILPPHCCCRLYNSPCFGVESRYSPPVPEPTSWPRLQLLSPSRQASEVACFTSPKWQLLHHLQCVPALRQLLSTAHGSTPTSPILLVDPVA